MDNFTLLENPAELPADPREVAGDVLIPMEVWAHLQGVKKDTVQRQRTRSEANRRANALHDGDMPREDRMIRTTPYWEMATFWKWFDARPGKGTNAGRPPGSGRPRPAKELPLPADCPHCRKEITSDDVPMVLPGGARTEYSPKQLRGEVPKQGRGKGKKAVPVPAFIAGQ